jgi:hypothetical protein
VTRRHPAPTYADDLHGKATGRRVRRVFSKVFIFRLWLMAATGSEIKAKTPVGPVAPDAWA